AAGLVAGAALGVALAGAERLAGLAGALADAAGAFLAVAELRHVDLRQRDADEVLALLADHLAAADVLAEVALDLAADELAEALVVAFDLLPHGNPHYFHHGTHGKHGIREILCLFSVFSVCSVVYFFAWPRAKMLATKVSTSVALDSL